jgi:hypothetical protein
MNTQLHPTIDRSGWSKGPWDREPDREEWNHQGTPCLATRSQFGSWCGFAGVYPGHALYRVPYQSVRNLVEVHGGLTYSDVCSGHVCHEAIPTDPPGMVWWFGFDCGHAFDMSPGMEAYLHRLDIGYAVSGIYRDLDYVRAEVQALAEQLHELG